MAEGDDYTPAPWAAQHDFKSARASYDRNAGRSYADAQAKNVTASDLVPDQVATKSKHPLLIWCDTTGSMGGWALAPPTLARRWMSRARFAPSATSWLNQRRQTAPTR